ncbi:hypothetical protein P7K49_006236 [Saguinus oedipus]|uniref:Uncharacterized protein n=1 Tax=Saguinus oedipus TaxID=9490 RepID=A0ABQ9W1U1_SAGOE|nr:hypothetical protein P7K49_006236 [Saguinus oedipus]
MMGVLVTPGPDLLSLEFCRLKPVGTGRHAAVGHGARWSRRRGSHTSGLVEGQHHVTCDLMAVAVADVPRELAVVDQKVGQVLLLIAPEPGMASHTQGETLHMTLLLAQCIHYVTLDGPAAVLKMETASCHSRAGSNIHPQLMGLTVSSFLQWMQLKWPGWQTVPEHEGLLMNNQVALLRCPGTTPGPWHSPGVVRLAEIPINHGLYYASCRDAAGQQPHQYRPKRL